MGALTQAQCQAATAFMGETLARTEKYDAAALGDYQKSHLTHLLHFAHAQSPFYRERLAPLFRKNGSVDWSRWHQVPIAIRADLKETGPAMMAKALPVGHGEAHAKASSGTTAMPVTVYCSTMMMLAGTAAFERACRWYGRNPNDRFCVTFDDDVIGTLDHRNWNLGGDGNLADEKMANHLAVGLNWPPERILALMAQHRCTCFSGSAAVLEDVAAAQLEQRENLALKFLVGISMPLTERARELVPKAFNAKAYSAYTSKEAHKIAHECPVSGGFHVNSELVLVEIVDDAGKPCGLGETGRVIVTPLLGTAQPLIRYEQGDFATWGETCPCGRAHPIIARIDGRMRNRFCFANGRRFLPGIGHVLYRDLLKADRWQVAQTGNLEIQVRFISSAPDEAIDFGALTQIFLKHYHPDLNVTYRRVAVMPLTAAGKFLDYVNEYDGQSGAAL